MNKLDSTLSSVLGRAFAVIGKLSEMDTVLRRIYVSRITTGTENGLQVSIKYTALIGAMMGELIHEIQMVKSYLKKENEDPNGTATEENIYERRTKVIQETNDLLKKYLDTVTEEKKFEEEGPKMAEAALKAIESINNATD